MSVRAPHTQSLTPAWRCLLAVGEPMLAGLGTALAMGWTGAGPTGPAWLVPVLAVVATLAAKPLWRGEADGLPAWVRNGVGLATVAGAAVLAGVATGLAEAHAALLAAVLVGTCAAFLRLLAGMVGGHVGVRHVVVVGPADCRARLREHLAGHPALRMKVIAEVGPVPAAPTGPPLFGLGDLERTVAEFEADEVLISTGFDGRQFVMETMARLLDRPLVVRYVPDPEALPLFCPRPADLAGLPAIDLSRGPLSPAAEAAKWAEDKLVALAALVLLGLPMLFIAAAIKLTSRGPVLFVQERHGQHGRPIRVYKFRTMRTEHCTPDITTGRFRQAGPGDHRVTWLGRLLRNTSLDETPQFLNVLFGDMSVVGPRPHPIALNRRFASDIGELMRRHYVKPGITGLAQISGARGETRTVEDMRRRVNFDLEYLRRWSLWLDLRIILYTVFNGWINRQP